MAGLLHSIRDRIMELFKALIIAIKLVGICCYPPTQKTSGVSPGMNASDGPAVALAKAGS